MRKAASRLCSVTLVALLCATGAAAQLFQREGNITTYRGNTITFAARTQAERGQPAAQTPSDMDSTTVNDSIPIALNGNTIYRTWEVTSRPAIHADAPTIPEYVFAHLTRYLNHLPDGIYKMDLHSIVIDATGHVVFYEGMGLCGNTDIPYRLKDLINAQADKILYNTPPRFPATLAGHKVAMLTNLQFIDYEIKVKHHHTFITRRSKNKPII